MAQPKIKNPITSKVLTPHQIAEHEKAIQKERTERAQAAKSALEKWSVEFKCELQGVPVYVQSPQGGFITAIEIKNHSEIKCMLLQAGTIPDTSTIKDDYSLLVWVIGFLVALLVVVGIYMRGLMNKQETQYEARINDLKAALLEEEKEKKAAQDEVKEINKTVISQIVPTMQSINQAMGAIVENDRKNHDR